MKPEDRNRVTAVIEANTERVALGELAAKGKSHVRVISGKKAMELIEAIVDQTIARRAGELAEGDRDRIVKEAAEQFQRVSRIQAEAEGLVLRQSELIDGQGARIKELERKLKNSLASLRRREKRLGNARETILNYDREIDRLGLQVRNDATVIEDLQTNLRERTDEVRRLQDLMAKLTEDVDKARRSGEESEGLSKVRDELAEMKAFLIALDRRGGEPPDVEAMLARLQERDASSAAQLEERFAQTMQQTLESISKTLHRATARPLDRPIEATDVLVSKVFDTEGEMDTNLTRLDVEVMTAKEGIAKSLARLKRLREEAAGEDLEEATPPA